MESLDWEYLPEHLLSSILANLISVSDYLRFSAVCKRWHSVACQDRMLRGIFNTSRPQLPLLLIPTPDSSETKRGLYSLLDNKVLSTQVEVPYDKRCSGSSHGWLFLVSIAFEVTMFNPFTGARIELPRMLEEVYEDQDNDDYYYFHIKKAVLSCDPTFYPDDYEVAVTYGGMYDLALYRPGDQNWRCVPNHPGLRIFHDILYYRGSFHVVDNYMGVGKIVAGKDTDPEIEMIVPRAGDPWDPMYEICSYSYLVEASWGELILVRRFMDEDEDEAQLQVIEFKVYRIENPEGESLYCRLSEMEGLGKDSVFVGDNQSLAISTTEFCGCHPNCIFYTDDRGVDLSRWQPHGPRDIGVFDLEKRELGSHYVPEPSQKHMPPATWIVPSLPL